MYTNKITSYRYMNKVKSNEITQKIKFLHEISGTM